MREFLKQLDFHQHLCEPVVVVSWPLSASGFRGAGRVCQLTNWDTFASEFSEKNAIQNVADQQDNAFTAPAELLFGDKKPISYVSPCNFRGGQRIPFKVSRAERTVPDPGNRSLCYTWLLLVADNLISRL